MLATPRSPARGFPGCLLPIPAPLSLSSCYWAAEQQGGFSGGLVVAAWLWLTIRPWVAVMVLRLLVLTMVYHLPRRPTGSSWHPVPYVG
jgi:hypothetical protein